MISLGSCKLSWFEGMMRRDADFIPLKEQLLLRYGRQGLLRFKTAVQNSIVQRALFLRTVLELSGGNPSRIYC